MDLTWATVLSQAKLARAATQEPMRWNSNHWRRWLACNGSAAVRSAFEELDKDHSVSGLRRTDVLMLAQQARQNRGSAAMRFLLATMLWGYADTDGRGPWRVAQMTAGHDCGSRVLSVLDSLEENGVREGYRRIQDRRRCGLPWLGASYGTKVLYFGGYEARACASQRPLVLDEFVARAFRHLEALDGRFHPGWCWRNYSMFLKRVSEHAQATVREDDIEYRLFEIGKELPAN